MALASYCRNLDGLPLRTTTEPHCTVQWWSDPVTTGESMLRSAALSTAQDEEEDNIDDRLRLIAGILELERWWEDLAGVFDGELV